MFLVLFAGLTNHNKAEAFYRTLTFDRDGSGWIFFGSHFYGDPPHDYYFYYPVPHQFNIWVHDPQNPPKILQEAVPGDSDRFDKWETNDPSTDESTNPTLEYDLTQNTTTKAIFTPWSISAIEVTADSFNAALKVYIDRNLQEVKVEFEPDKETKVNNPQPGEISLNIDQRDFWLYGKNQLTISGKQGSVTRSIYENVNRTEELNTEYSLSFEFFFEGIGYATFPGSAYEKFDTYEYSIPQSGDTTKNIASGFTLNLLNLDWYENITWAAEHRLVLNDTTEDWTLMPKATGASQQFSQAKAINHTDKWTNPLRGEFRITGFVYNSFPNAIYGVPTEPAEFHIDF